MEDTKTGDIFRASSIEASVALDDVFLSLSLVLVKILKFCVALYLAFS